MIVIVGGGITGLAAAYELARRDVAFLAARGIADARRPDPHRARRRLHDRRAARLDAGAEAGGASSSARSSDSAAQLMTDARRARRSSCATGGSIRCPRRRSSAFRRRSRRCGDTTLLDWPARLRAGARAARSSGRRPRTSRSAAFFRRRFGPATVDLIAQPLLGGIHAGDIERLSMRSVFPRLLDRGATDAAASRGSLRWRSARRRHRHVPCASRRHGRARRRDRDARCHAAPCARAPRPRRSQRRGSGWTVAAGADGSMRPP